MLKRAFDIVGSFLGLLVISPLLILITLWIVLRDGRPVIFKQRRIGLNGRPFLFWKFRTMVASLSQDTQLATTSDTRITKTGAFLRNYKLDELPQLWNVLKGDISFVGYRPEIPYYVQKYNDWQKEILKYKPGIVDPATLFFKDENAILNSSTDIEKDYIQKILPTKIKLSLDYTQKATFFSDIDCILKTLRQLLLKS